MISIPSSERKWTKVNNSDLYGNVYVTKNVNFDQEGYLQLSNAVKASYSESLDTSFDQAVCIIYNGDLGAYYVFTTDEPYTVPEAVMSEAPTQDVGANNPNTSFDGDACWYTDKLVVSEQTSVVYYNSGTNAWVNTNISLSNPAFSDHRHSVENFRSKAMVAIADVSTVKLYSTMSATPTLSQTLTISSDLVVTCMTYFNQNLYIGTQSPYGGEAFMFVWDGSGTAAQAAYKVDAVDIFDICVFQDSVVLYAGNGALLRFNGSGFTLLEAFPIFYTPRILSASVGQNFLKPNGDVLYISFCDGTQSEKKLLTQPAGIWCYDPKVGLYHKYSFSLATSKAESINTTAVNTTTDVITVVNNWVTGTEVYYRDNGGITMGGLTDEGLYFVINVSATTIKLATSFTNALAGTAVDITGTGANSQTLVFFPKTDFGQNTTDNRAFAILPIQINVDENQYGEDVIWSGELGERNTTLSKGYVGSTSPALESRGYFITPKIFSNDVVDTYQKIYLKYVPLRYDIDKIIVKYRTTDDVRDTIDMSNSIFWKITWTSTTTFTTTQADWSSAVAGNEVEVLEGAGAGLLAHITSISEAAGTYTVTIDETFRDYLTGDIGKAVFRNWTKAATITSADSDGYKEIAIAKTGKFTQVKVELRGIQVRIEELQVINAVHKPSA